MEVKGGLVPAGVSKVAFSEIAHTVRYAIRWCLTHRSFADSYIKEVTNSMVWCCGAQFIRSKCFPPHGKEVLVLHKRAYGEGFCIRRDAVVAALLTFLSYNVDDVGSFEIRIPEEGSEGWGTFVGSRLSFFECLF